MKNIIFLFLLFVSFFGQAQKISTMPAATSLGGSDLVPIVQGGVNKAAPGSLFIYTPALPSDLNTGTDNTKFATGSTLQTSKYLTQDGSKISGTASGTNIYTVSVSPAITSYSFGQSFIVKFTHGNTAACSLSVCSLTSIPLYKSSGGSLIPLASGDILDGQILELFFDGTNLQTTIGGGGSGTITYSSLTDVSLSGLVNGQFSRFNGTDWVNVNISNSDFPVSGITASTYSLLTTNAQGICTNGSHIVVTGDATATEAGGSIPLVLVNVNSNVGSFGSTTQIPRFSVNAKGQILSVTLNNIAAPWSGVTGTPTTRDGYGITDVYTKIASDALYQFSLVSGTNIKTVCGNSLLGTGDVGTIPMLYGGTGQTTQQAAINALTGTQVAGKYLRSDGTNSTLSTIQAADVPTLNQNTTGTASNITGTTNSTITTLSVLSLPYSQVSGTPTNSSYSFSGLSDVSISSPSNNQISVYNSGTSKWNNMTLIGSMIPDLSATYGKLVNTQTWSGGNTFSSTLNANTISSSTGAITIKSADQTGTNIVGNNYILKTGQGTGNSQPGYFQFSGYKKGTSSGTTVGTAQTYGYLGVNSTGVNDGALYLGSSAPSSTNYSLWLSGGTLSLNGPSSGLLNFNVANTNLLQLNSSNQFLLSSNLNLFGSNMASSGASINLLVTETSTNSNQLISTTAQNVLLSTNDNSSGNISSISLTSNATPTLNNIILSTSGNISLNTGFYIDPSGAVHIPSSSNRSGSSTLAGGTVTISNTIVTSSSIVLPIASGTTNAGALSVTITPGTGFVVNSTNASDARSFKYIILENN